MPSAGEAPTTDRTREHRSVQASTEVRGRDLDVLAGLSTWLLALGLLLFFSEAIRFVIVNPGGQGSTVLADDPVRAPAQLLIFALTGILLAFKWRVSIEAIRAAWPFWGLSLVALLSVAWSLDRALSLRYGIWLTATAFLGMHFDLRFNPRSQLRLIGAALAVVVLASIVFILWYPTFGLEPSLHAGAWRGAFIHKNSLGRAMALAALVYALLLPGARRSAAYLVTALAASAVLGWYSRSATAPILFVMIAGLIPLRFALRQRTFRVSTVVASAAAVATLASWIAYLNADALLGIIGRDVSLSGRPLLWASLIPEILDRPVLGFGLGAFWKGSTGAAAGVEKLVGWNPGQAHNGFIDAAVDLGLLGFGMLLLALGVIGLKALRYARAHSASASGIWPVAYLAFFALSNMTESSILRANTIFWFLFAAVSTRVMFPREERST